MSESKSIIIAAMAYMLLVALSFFWKPKEIVTSNTKAIDSTYYEYNKKIDSLESELFIAQLKLERIKEYNRIAAKDNNIKYLRGWINRVLEE